MAENTKSYCTAENTKYSTAETPEFCYPCRYDGVQPLRSILRKSLIHSFPAHPGLSPSSKRKHTVQPRWDSGIVLESFFGIFRPEQTSVGFSQTRNMSCAPAGWSWEPSTHSQGTTTGKAPRWLCPPSSTSHRSIPPPPKSPSSDPSTRLQLGRNSGIDHSLMRFSNILLKIRRYFPNLECRRLQLS